MVAQFQHSQSCKSTYYAQRQAHVSPIDKWPWRCRFKVKLVPMNLSWSESAWWLLCCGIHTIPGAFLTPMGTSMWAWWGNKHDVAHLWTKMVLINLIWSESTQWLQSSSLCQIPEARITPMDMPDGPNGQMTMMLHIYRPGWFQWTWFGVNQPSGCWGKGSTNLGWQTKKRTNGCRHQI